MTINDDTEMTVRAVVDGKHLAGVALPEPLVLTDKEAELIAEWAKNFCGTCMNEGEIYMGDIRPSSALKMLPDLKKEVGQKIRYQILEARKYGFGMRLMRDADNPYKISITRRVIDVPQLTIPCKSLNTFLRALGYNEVQEDKGLKEVSIGIESFAARLVLKGEDCMDMGVAHYRDYCIRIVEYGNANGAMKIMWGPERRGSVSSTVANPAEARKSTGTYDTTE